MNSTADSAHLAGENPDRDAFRRHVFAVHKDGGTPE